MNEHDHLAVMNFEKTICENLSGVDYGGFKDENVLNESSSLTFTVYRTSDNRFEYDMLICENFIIFQGQTYVIKQTTPKAEGNIVSVEVVAHHTMYEFQNHYVESNRKDDEDSTEETTQSYTLEEYLKYVFANQKTQHKFKYKIYGSFTEKVEIDELGGKNGIEAINDGIELFDYIIYPKDDEIGFYKRDVFYQPTENVIRYKHNTDNVSASVSTLELRTAIKAYGKKYSASETKNYSPIKTPQLTYSSSFKKESSYYSETPSAKQSYVITCKFGDETLRHTIKKGPLGGLFETFVDGNSLGTKSCWAKSSSSETIDLIKGLSKGRHTVEFVFKGDDPVHKPPTGKKSRFYAGTEKSTVLNLIANTIGDKAYKAVYEYVSPQAKKYGLRYANTVTNDQISNVNQLKRWAMSQLQDTPKTELTVNYISYDSIGPRDTVIFVHELMGFNTELKVVSITKGHPFTNTIAEVSFSNEIKDMVQIQQALNKRLRAQDNKFNYQAAEINKLYSRDMSSPFTTETIGSVLE
ncbi:prophage endopeptidase tail family protein [Mammaliicoccus sciuri]|uniref:prophage endopeptidase tail family protein n=1 Tax=Mammaliicoccus sciuri TaxID=1296 RepID=UPI000D1E8C08|nr:prophage endopeptidase tail family protein [Mammaliicoccus sciuri]PTK27522.1 peptidase [Mammaliicoccus sciuri]